MDAFIFLTPVYIDRFEDSLIFPVVDVQIASQKKLARKGPVPP